ncbi:MAG: metallophosphoesterase [Acidimicrobiia bacterium]
MAQPRFRFVFLADTQLGCYATFSGFDDAKIAAYADMGMAVRQEEPVEGLEWDAARYRRAVEMINAIRPAFVLIGGDLIDDPNSDDQTEEFLAITARVDPEVTVRLVAGNHDIAPDALVPTAESIARYRERFGPDWYAFTHERTRFVVMNTTVIDHPENVEDEWSRQWEFLEGELSEARGRSVDHVVLAGHHPLFLETPDEPDTYWNLPAERRSPILDLARRMGVRIGFAGHWHRNHLATGGGFTQVISGPVGYPLGDDPSGIRTVDVSPDGLTHNYVPLGM